MDVLNLQARATIEARQAQLAQAQDTAEAAGWPALKGSEKQIKWALERNARAEEVPSPFDPWPV